MSPRISTNDHECKTLFVLSRVDSWTLLELNQQESRRETEYGEDVAESWENLSLVDRIALAVERVRERLMRAVAALESAKIPYAVAGGNAVAAWVATIDSSAVRNTQDVDILLRREDFAAAQNALQAVGFVHRKALGIDMFLDGADAKARDAIHILPAREKVRPDYSDAAPDVTDSVKPDTFQIVNLESLVKMKLTTFQLNDHVDLRDMLEIGLIDQSWSKRFSPTLAERPQTLIDSPEG